MPFDTAILHLSGTKSDGDPSTIELPVRLGSIPTRSIGLSGDALRLIAPADQWEPSDWDLTKPMSLTFGDSGSGATPPVVDALTLGGYRLLRVTALEVGADVDEDGTLGATPTDVRTIALELVTEPGWWKEGRGGIVATGTVNPLGDDGVVDSAHDDYLAGTELIEACFDAMGLTYDALPSSLDTWDAPGPLDWGNASAIDELEAVLAYFGHAAVFKNDGSGFTVVRLAKGGETIALGSLAALAETYQLYDAPANRATNIIVTSGSTRTSVIRSVGLSDLEWVWFDPETGSWLNATETTSGLDPDDLTTFKKGPDSPALSDKKQFGRLFRAVRLDSELIDEARRIVNIPQAVTLDDGTELRGQAAIMLGRYTVPGQHSQLRNVPESGSDDPVRIEGVRVMADEGVFAFPNDVLAVRMSPGPYGSFGSAAALSGTDLSVVFAHESHTGTYADDFLVVAYEASATAGVVTVSEVDPSVDEMAFDAIVEDPDTIRVDLPWLRRVVEQDGMGDWTEINLSDLKQVTNAIAQVRAGAAVAQSGVVELRGIVDVEPDGTITSVSWDLRRKRTILRINQHEVSNSELASREHDANRSFRGAIGRLRVPGTAADKAGPTLGGAPRITLDLSDIDPLNSGGTRGLEEAMATRRSTSNAPIVVPQAGAIQGTWLAKLTSASAMSSEDNRWEYQWEEVVASDTAGDFDTVSGGRTHTTHGLAYNLNEAFNDDAGVQGNGVDLGNLPSGFEMQPLGVCVVEMTGPFGDSGNEWCLFEAINSIDGECE